MSAAAVGINVQTRFLATIPQNAANSSPTSDKDAEANFSSLVDQVSTAMQLPPVQITPGGGVGPAVGTKLPADQITPSGAASSSIGTKLPADQVTPSLAASSSIGTKLPAAHITPSGAARSIIGTTPPAYHSTAT